MSAVGSLGDTRQPDGVPQGPMIAASQLSFSGLLTNPPPVFTHRKSITLQRHFSAPCERGLRRAKRFPAACVRFLRGRAEKDGGRDELKPVFVSQTEQTKTVLQDEQLDCIKGAGKSSWNFECVLVTRPSEYMFRMTLSHYSSKLVSLKQTVCDVF